MIFLQLTVFGSWCWKKVSIEILSHEHFGRRWSSYTILPKSREIRSRNIYTRDWGKRQTYTSITLRAGPRYWTGNISAILEMKAVLFKILRTYDILLVKGKTNTTITPIFGITAQTSGGSCCWKKVSIENSFHEHFRDGLTIWGFFFATCGSSDSLRFSVELLIFSRTQLFLLIVKKLLEGKCHCDYDVGELLRFSWGNLKMYLIGMFT